MKKIDIADETYVLLEQMRQIQECLEPKKDGNWTKSEMVAIIVNQTSAQWLKKSYLLPDPDFWAE